MKVNMGQPNDLLLDDLELLLREIDEFNTSCSNNKPLEIPQTLENYLQFVAKSGNTVFPWPQVRNLVRIKMLNAIQQFQEPTCPNETFVLERFDLFRLAAPFTVQRLTELILQPTRHYRKKEKFLRGLEKTVLVVSTIEPQSLTHDEDKNGNDASNTSSSSFEQDTEIVSYNRTITPDKGDSLAKVDPSINILNPSAVSENVVLDPVTTTVGTSENAIGQNISIVADSLVSESVTTSAVSPSTVISPEKVVAVSSDDVLLTAASDAAILSMDTNEGQDILTTSEGMDQTTSSSETIVLESVTSSAVEDSSEDDDMGHQTINITSGVATDGIALDAAVDVESTEDQCMETSEDLLSTSVHSAAIHVVNQSTAQSLVLTPVSESSIAASVDAIQNLDAVPVSIISENVPVTEATAVDIITPDKLIAVPADTIILDASSTTVLCMETSEGQEFLASSSSIEVIEESSSSEDAVIESATVSTIESSVDAVSENSAVAATDSLISGSVPEVPSVVASEHDITPDKVIETPDLSEGMDAATSGELTVETSDDSTTV